MSSHESKSALTIAIDKRTIDQLTAAVKREWGNGEIDNREPYRTNAASRAVLAVLAELDRIAGAK